MVRPLLDEAHANAPPCELQGALAPGKTGTNDCDYVSHTLPCSRSAHRGVPLCPKK